MAGKELEVLMADNFRIVGKEVLPSASYLERADFYLDERLHLYSANCYFGTRDWYYNYLYSASVIAGKNTSAKCQYLLDLGFIPIIYLPSCVSIHQSVTMFNVLDLQRIPYLKLPATSFFNNYYQNEKLDGWMSKMDINKLFGIPIEKITSEDVVRRIFE